MFFFTSTCIVTKYRGVQKKISQVKAKLSAPQLNVKMTTFSNTINFLAHLYLYLIQLIETKVTSSFCRYI